jgi:hypothetical protein
MDKQIQLFSPNENELEGLDNLISNIPELQELIEESGYNIKTISNGIRNLKGMTEEYKNMIMGFFKALNNNYLSSQVYKYSNFRNQEIIDKLLCREEEYKKIIMNQANKHNDNSGVEEMNSMFNAMIVKTKDNKKLSNYMNKSIKDIKFKDDFKPIFEKEGVNEYSKDELLKMKSNKKGTTFKDVNSITVVNMSKNKDFIVK